MFITIGFVLRDRLENHLVRIVACKLLVQASVGIKAADGSSDVTDKDFDSLLIVDDQ